jgi:hypothetical protein
MNTGFFIQRADGTFYRWDDKINAPKWVPSQATATVWYTRRVAEGVARLHAGVTVVQGNRQQA